MFPNPMSRFDFHPDDSPLDPAHTLEQHLLAGLPLDLALDLVLNELVVRAAAATHATAAALALLRGDEMVCRAATGHPAPGLGIPLNPRDGLSGACLKTRQPQLSVDTEFDPRVDPAIAHRLGIRSILIVPIFTVRTLDSGDSNPPLTGVLEVFSASPAAFSDSDQKLLAGFAEECARIRQTAIEIGKRQPAVASHEFIRPDFMAAIARPARRPFYQGWTLALGGLAILATIAVSFLIGSRIAWLRPPQPTSTSQIEQPNPTNSPLPEPVKSAAAAKSPATKPARAFPAKTAAAPAADELVVYEKGKVVFRMKPAPAKPVSDSVVEASSTAKSGATKAGATKTATTMTAPSPNVWLSPAQAEARLLGRTEPQYPSEALAAHRSGDVVLEVQVAEDGSVSGIRTLSGDPVLAAAATEAVRNWRYRPYRQQNHPAQFQTDVTLSFTLPD